MSKAKEQASADTALAEKIVSFLNKLLETDELTIRRLVTYSQQCSQALHNLADVHTHYEVPGENRVNVLDLLNGLCGSGDTRHTGKSPLMVAVLNPDSSVASFHVMKQEPIQDGVVATWHAEALKEDQAEEDHHKKSKKKEEDQAEEEDHHKKSKKK